MKKAGQGQDKTASPDVKQTMLWARDALRDIPDEVIKSCWRKTGILPLRGEPEVYTSRTRGRSVKAMLRCTRQHIILLIFLES